MSRAVERGLETVGMDEKSFLRGQSYASVLYDLKAGSERVLDVMEGRDASAARILWERIEDWVRENHSSGVFGYEWHL